MRYGTFIVGEYLGINDGGEFADTLRVRVGEPQPKTQRRDATTGYEERIEFNPFDPKTGKPMLPKDLKEHDSVVAKVKAIAKGYQSDKRGISGMTLYELQSISIVGAFKDATTEAIDAA